MTAIDILDIAVFSFFIYGLVMLLKQTRSFFVVVGIAIVAGVYALADFFGFRLTVMAFRLFFSVLVIGIVVIFQAELRRYFELIALWWSGAWRNHRVKKITPEYIQSIAAVAGRFTKEKVGMLVVIAGRESIMRHVQGGFPLNGKISEPILESIFDASSPGHDGAVIIEGGIMTYFGTHLPLSKDFGQIEAYGTRHSAGLGIAEVSDALALIVSEEKGTVSIARDGILKTVDAPEGVRAALEAFYEEKCNARALPQPRGIFKNMREKIAAVAGAAVAWFIFVYPHS